MIQAWKAMLVRRWHTNADLNHTVDPTGCHSARVVVLALYLKPKLTRAAIIYAVTHDIGEYRAGDFPSTFKWANPVLAKQIDAFETKEAAKMGFPRPELSDTEARIIKLCDGLDAWLWCKQHRPDLLARKDWHDMGQALADEASKLGVAVKVSEVMDT